MTPEEIRKIILPQTAIEPPAEEVRSVHIHKIGTVELGELPRTSSLGSNAALIGGYIGTIVTSGLVQDVIADIAKEDVSAYKITGKASFGEAFVRGIKRDLDPKLWKSNTGYWAALIGGVVLTEHVVKKMEQHNFASKHLPNVEQLKKLIDSAIADTHNHQPQENWQDKSQQSDSASRSI